MTSILITFSSTLISRWGPWLGLMVSVINRCVGNKRPLFQICTAAPPNPRILQTQIRWWYRWNYLVVKFVVTSGAMDACNVKIVAYKKSPSSFGISVAKLGGAASRKDSVYFIYVGNPALLVPKGLQILSEVRCFVVDWFIMAEETICVTW